MLFSLQKYASYFQTIYTVLDLEKEAESER